MGGLKVYIEGSGTGLRGYIAVTTRWNYFSSSRYSNIRLQLQKVCRQTYFEVTPFIYTLNTFGFDKVSVFDRWTKSLAFGQLQLVTSIHVPCSYFRLYQKGARRTFTNKFPHIKCIRLNENCIYCLGGSWGEAKETGKTRIVKQVLEREGDGVVVEW